jgi:RNA ligase
MFHIDSENEECNEIKQMSCIGALEMIDVEALLKYANANRKMISVVTYGNLVKLNYTQECQNKKIWNEHTLISRGIIVNKETNQVEQHPFNKFFNEFEYLAMGTHIPFGLKYWVTEKLDGVLIVPYRVDGELRFSTRGSFANEYIDKATEIAPFTDLPVDQYTFMFELISPSYSQATFLVTKYDHDALVLVGARNNQTDLLLSPPEVIALAHTYHLPVYQTFDWSFDIVKQQQEERHNSTEEGWVVFFENGFLVKMKRMEYLQLFRAINQISLKKIVELLRDGLFESFLASLPEELVKTAIDLRVDIDQQFSEKCNEVIAEFNAIPEEVKTDQREFSLYIIQHCPQNLLKYLYLYKSTLSTEELHPMFYKECLRKG